jgi:membrane-bound lytic murein transglycosylase A
MPLPDARPSEQIAKLFPQTDPKPVDPPKVEASAVDNKAVAKPDAAAAKPAVSTVIPPLPVAKPAAVAVVPAPAVSPPVATTVPLPEARPATVAKPQVKTEAKTEAKAEAKPKRAKSWHRVYRRAPKQPQSLFRFPWQ